MNALNAGVDRRLDRWLTLSVAAPLSALLPVGAQALRVPLLMYHSIADDTDEGVHPYFRTVTSPRVFEQQMQTLRREGFEAITLSQAVQRLLRPEAQATGTLGKSVVITFDDGFRDMHTTALPILQAAGFSATVFVPSAYIGKRFINGRDCLDAAQMRELCAHGIEFGSHSASHRKLVELGRTDLDEELRSSKKEIEDRTGREVTLFSYPFGFPQADKSFTAVLAELLTKNGYRAGVTTTIGRSTAKDNILFLPRLPINDCDDAALLHAKLAGHYDWLRTGQRLQKQSRRWLGRWRRA